MSATAWVNTANPIARRTGATMASDRLDALLTAVGVRRDDEAFSILFDHFVPRVRAKLVRLGLAPVAAEDVTQDVMETIWRKAHLYDARKSGATTWIFHIARNRRIDLRRRTREFCAPPEDFLAIPDAADGNDDCLDAARREQCVRTALGALPQEQIALVRLAFFEGLSHSAIAKRLQLPLGTVKSRLRLAFGRLRRLLHEAGVTGA